MEDRVQRVRSIALEVTKDCDSEFLYKLAKLGTITGIYINLDSIDPPLTIGRLLKIARACRGQTQEEVASIAEISQGTLSQIENDKNDRWSAISKLCKFYGIDLIL